MTEIDMREPYMLYGTPIKMNDGAEYYIDKDSLIGDGGYSLIYRVRSGDAENPNRFLLKEFFPKTGAKRNEDGKVVPLNDDDTIFREKRELFEKEYEIGGEAGRITHQTIHWQAYGDGYGLMEQVSDDTCTILELVKKWQTDPPCSIDPFWVDLGRIKSSLLIIKSLLVFLEELHGNHLLHLDISFGNIFFAGPNCESGTVYVSDYGCAIQANEENIAVFKDRHSHYSGGFSAPELLKRKGDGFEVSAKTDLYSVGALFLFLCLGRSVTEGSLDAPKCCLSDFSNKFDLCEYIRPRFNKIRIAEDLKKKIVESIVIGSMKSREYQTAEEMLNAVEDILKDIPGRPFNPDRTKDFTLYSLKALLEGSNEPRYSWATELMQRRGCGPIDSGVDQLTSIIGDPCESDEDFLMRILPTSMYRKLRMEIGSDSIPTIMAGHVSDELEKIIIRNYKCYSRDWLKCADKALNDSDKMLFYQRLRSLFEILDDECNLLRTCCRRCDVRRDKYIGLVMLTLFALLGKKGFSELLDSPQHATNLFERL